MVFLSGAIFWGGPSWAIASAQGLDATDFGGMAQSGEASLGRSYWACGWSENEIFDILRCGKPIPIGSMYAIYGNIYHQYTYTSNVSIYTIHGSYGIVNPQISRFIDVYRVYATEFSDIVAGHGNCLVWFAQNPQTWRYSSIPFETQQ